MQKKRVLFLCTGNSCRSQMAEGLLRSLAGDKFEAYSAGMDEKEEVHPLAVKAMAEIGIDISSQRPKSLKEFLGRIPISYLIVVCNKANQTCPRIWPGLNDNHRLYWPFEDPAEAIGTEEERMAVFRKVRDEIKDKLTDWLKSFEESSG